MPKIFQSKKGGAKFAHEGYVYNKRKDNNRYWLYECENRRHKGCTGQVRVYKQNEQMQVMRDHTDNCVADENLVEARLLKVSYFIILIYILLFFG